MGYGQRLTPDQAFQKAKHYCAYQERGHQEVKEKLYSFGLRSGEVDDCLARLIEENYLNEERFAVQFAGGRFRMKQWGRVKIRYELKQRQVGDYNIKKGLAAIDPEDYARTLTRLAESKWEELRKEPQEFIRRRKLHEYLLQKGYETDLVQVAVKEIKPYI